jgi:hypothetical protein
MQPAKYNTSTFAGSIWAETIIQIRSRFWRRDALISPEITLPYVPVYAFASLSLPFQNHPDG